MLELENHRYRNPKCLEPENKHPTQRQCMEGDSVTSSLLQATYLVVCLVLGWTPQPWED